MRRGRRLLGGLALAPVALGAAFAPKAATLSRLARGAPALAPVAFGDLVTYGYGNSRFASDPVGPRIGGLSARAVWDDRLGGAVYGEPLVDAARVYVATESDTVVALAATTGKVVWRLQIGRSVPLAVVDSAPTLGSGCGDVDPLGVTGTPVIDPASGELFVAEETLLPGPRDWRHIRHVMVAISLATHRVLWRRVIDPPGGNRQGTYEVPAEQQRPALTLAAGRVYASFGGLYGDCGQYRGYVVAVAESGAGALTVFGVPTQREGAIWGTGGAMISATGEMYVATGNGASSAPQHFDEGNSVIELSPALRRTGLWAPLNWAELSAADADLGSSGPIAVPGTSLLFVAGKAAPDGSVGYLMATGRLGGVGGGAFTGRVCPTGGVFGADAAEAFGSGASRRTMVFVPCGSGTVGLEVTSSPERFRRVWVVSSGSPTGSPVAAGGLVWALDTSAGRLYAMRPATGQVVLERATDPLEHFVAPGVAEHMVLVPTAAGVEAFRALS